MTFDTDNLLLAIDPASQVTGYALLKGLRGEDLIDAGLLRGSEARLPNVGDDADWLNENAELAACRRILSIVAELRGMLEEYAGRVGAAVIEVPSGKCGTGSRRGARGSLTTYGLAAGALWMALGVETEGWDFPTYPVTERQWTRSVVEKRLRPAFVRTIYGRAFDAAGDAGADAADAVLLGRWWIERAERSKP